MKLTKHQLDAIIMEELKKAIEEEALIDPTSLSASGTGTIDIFTFDDTYHSGLHKKADSYMAKPQLEKIAEYSKKLHDMICHGEQLDDWMESHIAQMADDIAEVYHALSYDKKYHT